MMKRILFLYITTVISFAGMAQFSCAGLVTTNASYKGFPQFFTVPAGVTQVRISITGGSGGQCTDASATNTAGGGATVWAYITVVAGDVFRVIVGQKGGNGDFEAGGGGSSAVYKNGTLIMVAGGGGGEDNTGNGGNGVTANNGTNGAPTSGSTTCPTNHVNDALAVAGANGANPGEFCAANTNGGGGGGGLNSAGVFKAGVGGLNMGGGQGSVNGVNGGAAGTNNGGTGDGIGTTGGWGWSGGGGADHRESGGGGGYGGGGGAPEGGNPGGGGSFIAAIGTNGITNSGSSNGVGTTTGANGSGIICATALITLPVTLESFTVQKNRDRVLLQWSTSQEISTAWYIVEKSTDGIHFTAIAQVAAAGNSTGIRHYSAADSAAVTGKIYYRIKIIDMDGRYTYSATRFVDISPKNVLTVYPNPVTDRLSVVLPGSFQQGNILLQISNSRGQIVMQKNTLLLQNDFDVSGLPPGIYILRAANERQGIILTAKFVK